MTRRASSTLRRPVLGIVSTLAAVAVVTGAVFGLREVMPVLSLGALYVFAVLPVAIVWGRAYAVLTAVTSMLAFNFFFLPPLHTFRLEERENWLVLAVYLVTAIVVSDLAGRARRRASEAERREGEEAALAELALALLHGRSVEQELVHAARPVAAALGVTAVRFELGALLGARDSEAAVPLETGTRRLGTLYVEDERAVGLARDRAFISAIASLLAVALDRETLEREAVEAESLRISDAVKTAILRAVSHELRSPLTAVRVAAESLASPELSLSADEQRRQVETVQTETRRLDRLVANLLDMSRLQAGVAAPVRELVSADELVVQALAELRGEDTRVEVSLPDDVPLVDVDAVQIERTLVNLLENALRFSPRDESVRLAVSVRGDETVFSVADRGSGVPASELERVFEPFTQVSPDERGGTGLGLAIARGFAEANGGRIWVESRPGEGATFHTAFPLAEAVVRVE
jgi:two-component system, OmpR family, sensor histidine kinase KdpD